MMRELIGIFLVDHREIVSAVVTIDASMIAGLSLALAIQYMNPLYFTPPYRTPIERGLLAIAFLLLLTQTTTAMLWDMWHDNTQAFAQFPLGARFTFTLPALLLTNFALIKRAIRIRFLHARH